MSQTTDTYHDWYLVGIVTSPFEDRLDIILTYDDLKRTVRFFEVKRCVFNNFELGNIVSNIKVLGKDAAHETILKDTALRELFDFPHENEHFNNAIKDIMEGRLVLIKLNPSYGCIGQILCGKIEEIQENIL